MQAFLSSCPIVSAIRQLAFADDPAPLRAPLGRQPDVAVTPVQDPDYPTNSLPLHVAIAESCLTALEVVLPITQMSAFSCVDGKNETVLQLAQRLFSIHLNGPEHLARQRVLLLVIHFFLSSQIKLFNKISREMRELIERPSTKGVIHDQFHCL